MLKKLLMFLDMTGIWSPTACKAYINPMLNLLPEHRLGSYIGNIYCGTPTVADDVCLAAGNAHELRMRSIIPTAHNSDSPLLRRPIFPTMQNRTQSTNPWFNQVYPTGCSVGQANLDEPWPRQNVLERKRSFYPRLYIPVQGNYDRPTWYGES